MGSVFSLKLTDPDVIARYSGIDIGNLNTAMQDRGMETDFHECSVH